MKPSAWGPAALLTAVYILAFVDRQVLNLLLESVRLDLNINDTQASLLVGAAFAILYVTAGLPLGWLADRANRRNIIAASVGVWTVMTAACGLANSYWALFLARVGVGIGEAGLSPAAISMIGDAYPPARRSGVLGLYASGVSVGSALALIGGGALIAAAPTISHALAPLLGPLRPWQVVFLVVALPGLVLGPLILLLKEPPRGAAPTVLGGPPADTILAFMKARAGVYLPLCCGLSTLTILGYGYSAWLPTLFIRVHGWSVSEIGLRYGLVLLALGPLGALMGGWFCDRRIAAGRTDVHWWVIVVSLPMLGAFYALAASLPDARWAFAALLPATIFGSAPSGAAYSALVHITPPAFRARVLASYGLIQSVLGLTIGPTAVGLMTDYLFASPTLIGRSMTVLALAAGASGLLLVLSCRRGYRRLAAEASAS